MHLNTFFRNSFVTINGFTILLIVLIFLGTSTLSLKQMNLQGREFVNLTMLSLLADWNTKKFLNYTSNELQQHLTAEQLDKMNSVFIRLGNLLNYYGAHGGLFISSTNSWHINPRYKVQASFQGGYFLAVIILIKQQGKWVIGRFDYKYSFFPNKRHIGSLKLVNGSPAQLVLQYLLYIKEENYKMSNSKECQVDSKDNDDDFLEGEDDELCFADEDPAVLEEHSKDTWKVMIVDDEAEVHRITERVLRNFDFEGKKLTLFSAYSAKEAAEILRANPDIATILLDVVMEEEDAGLKFVELVRKGFKNSLVRIILRTGQPGQAPEREVIVKYEINDYQQKSEMTSLRLFTVMVSTLRSFRDLSTKAQVI